MCMFGRVRHRVPHDVLRILPQCSKEIKLFMADYNRFFFYNSIYSILFVKNTCSYNSIC